MQSLCCSCKFIHFIKTSSKKCKIFFIKTHHFSTHNKTKYIWFDMINMWWFCCTSLLPCSVCNCPTSWTEQKVNWICFSIAPQSHPSGLRLMFHWHLKQENHQRAVAHTQHWESTPDKWFVCDGSLSENCSSQLGVVNFLRQTGVERETTVLQQQPWFSLANKTMKIYFEPYF